MKRSAASIPYNGLNGVYPKNHLTQNNVHHKKYYKKTYSEASHTAIGENKANETIDLTDEPTRTADDQETEWRNTKESGESSRGSFEVNSSSRNSTSRDGSVDLESEMEHIVVYPEIGLEFDDEETDDPGPKLEQPLEFSCKVCDQVFDAEDLLVMHEKIEHRELVEGEENTFTPEDLEFFYTVFTRMNISRCPICNKPVGNKLNWKRHLYTHSSVRKYECRVCSKSFSRSDHCKYHEKRHKMADIDDMYEEVV